MMRRTIITAAPPTKATRTGCSLAPGKLHEMTNHRQCFKPIPQLIEELNRHLEGWKNYFDFGYPRVAFGEVNTYVRYRLTQHLRRRSQRPFRPPEGVSFYEQIQRFGLVRL